MSSSKWPPFCLGLNVLKCIELEQNSHCFADNMFMCIFLNENDCILIHISMQFLYQGQNDNELALL